MTYTILDLKPSRCRFQREENKETKRHVGRREFLSRINNTITPHTVLVLPGVIPTVVSRWGTF